MRTRIAVVLLALGCAACSTSDGASTGTGTSGCWEGHDDGICTLDAQCPKGVYCDYTLIGPCIWDGGMLLPDSGVLPWGPFERASEGICRPDCGGLQGA